LTPVLPIPVRGTGDNTVTAKLCALNIAQRVKGILAPRVIDVGSREGVLALRHLVDEHARQLAKSTSLNGHGRAWWADPTSPYKN
jgi:hypothetical protein